MRNEDVAKAFLNRRTASVNNLSSSGDKLFSYNTCIAQWVGSTLIGNATKYSTTTSRHLGYIKQCIKCWTSKIVPMGTQDLTNYMKEYEKCSIYN